MTATGAFVGTNIDDFVALSLLVLGMSFDQLRPRQIFAGQYLGFAGLLVISGAAATGLAAVPTRWAGLLGLVPLALGAAGFGRLARNRHRDNYQPIVVNGIWPVAIVTIANGGDNVAVYSLLFRDMKVVDLAMTIVTFLLLLTAWCAGALVLGKHKWLVPGFIRTGRWTTPTVFIVVGVVILIRTGVLAQIRL
jgi:cadmium resistance protein CadD (predicted permease)